MRHFSTFEKDIIMDISRYAENTAHSFGWMLLPTFNQMRISLLTIREGESTFTAFFGSPDGKTKETNFSKIISILSLYEYLKEESLIYCMEENGNISKLYDGSNVHPIGLAEKQFFPCYFDNGRIEEKNNGIVMLDTKGHNPKFGTIVEHEIANKVCCYLASKVYPTQTLINIVDNQFKTDEEIRYESEIKLTRKSLNFTIFALFVSIFAPLGMTFFNNEFSVSTIQKEQFNEHLDVVSGISDKIETIGQNIDSIKKKTTTKAYPIGQK